MAVVVLSAGAAYAKTCKVSEMKDSLRKSLLEYYSDPAKSTLTAGQIKDLLTYYLEIPSGMEIVDCSGQGANSNIAIGSIVTEASALQNSIPVCSDGTQYAACSSAKPLYCYSGKLVSRCDLCGCPAAYTCQPQTNKCIQYYVPEIPASTTTLASSAATTMPAAVTTTTAGTSAITTTTALPANMSATTTSAISQNSTTTSALANMTTIPATTTTTTASKITTTITSTAATTTTTMAVATSTGNGQTCVCGGGNAAGDEVVGAGFPPPIIKGVVGWCQDQTQKYTNYCADGGTLMLASCEGGTWNGTYWVVGSTVHLTMLQCQCSGGMCHFGCLSDSDCQAGYRCFNQTCRQIGQEPQCQDTHSSDPYYDSVGYCADASGTHYNYCSGSTVFSYYCSPVRNATLDIIKNDCVAGGYVCPNGCSNGACNQGTTATTIPTGAFTENAAAAYSILNQPQSFLMTMFLMQMFPEIQFTQLSMLSPGTR